MGARGAARTFAGGRIVHEFERFNARHPWSHNDAFHPWILTRLPHRRHDALDIGCGRGELLAALAVHFDRVSGLDPDAGMRRVAASRCAGLANVDVMDTPMESLDQDFDLVTMVAVLHHLDLERALASILTNPIFGMVRHPWPSNAPNEDDPFPTHDPHVTVDEIRAAAERILPGARVRRHLGFRHTIEWTAPEEPSGSATTRLLESVPGLAESIRQARREGPGAGSEELDW